LRNCATGAASTVGGGLSNVASGACSTVGGGDSNTASGHCSAISGGYGHTASADYATVGGGVDNTASAEYTTISGGEQNNAIAESSTIGGGSNHSTSGFRSTIAGGFANCTTGSSSTIIGGEYGKASKYGEVAHAAGQFAQKGDAQHSILVARKSTTSTTTTYLALDGNTSRITLTARDTAWTFDIKVIAINSTEQESGSWHYRGGIYRDDNNNVGFIGSIIEEINRPSGKTGTVALQADGTNYALNINVTPGTTNPTRWVAIVDLVQVSFNTP